MKPDFFRHETLQDLEAANLGKFPMLVFEGLWGHCDKVGRFLWRPRQLKLDILPFLNFDMAETLQLLANNGFIRRYSVGGVEYGEIPSFQEHQRINGKEAQEPEKYPPPPSETGKEAEGKQQGSDGEATETTGREGKGRGMEIYVGLKPSPSDRGKALRALAEQIIQFLNEKAGKNFDAKGANLDFVLARLKDGESPEDVRAVVAMKARQWLGDEKMAQYLRPKTLFNRTNFATYKGELARV